MLIWVHSLLLWLQEVRRGGVQSVLTCRRFAAWRWWATTATTCSIYFVECTVYVYIVDVLFIYVCMVLNIFTFCIYIYIHTIYIHYTYTHIFICSICIYHQYTPLTLWIIPVYIGINQSYQLSDYRVSLPESGLFSPQRVCLLCYFDT